MANDVPVQLTTKRSLIALAIGLAAGVLIVGLPYLTSWLYAISTGMAPPDTSMTAIAGFNASLTLLFPALQGAGIGVSLGRGR